MHAKIILLPGSQTGERLCSVAEEILTDISVSFGHTFSILRDKIGEAAERTYGTPLSESTIRQCGAADAIFLGDRSAEGADARSYVFRGRPGRKPVHSDYSGQKG